MIPFPPPLTISLSPIHIPLLFPFFVYFFHCLLLPLHFPINRSLFLFTNSPIHTPMGRDKPSSFSSPSHFPFSNTMGFQDFKEEEKASTPSPPAPIQHHHRHHHLVFTAWITCGQGFKSLWLQDLHAIHTVYFDLAFKFMPLCCLFILCIS